MAKSAPLDALHGDAGASVFVQWRDAFVANWAVFKLYLPFVGLCWLLFQFGKAQAARLRTAPERCNQPCASLIGAEHDPAKIRVVVPAVKRHRRFWIGGNMGLELYLVLGARRGHAKRARFDRHDTDRLDR